MSMEVISINLWQTLISLCNLLILFLILKRFLYKPVKKTLEARRAAVDNQYLAAENAEKTALENKASWEQKLKNAQNEADIIINTAATNAKLRSETIIDEANKKASVIINQAAAEADLELKKAEASIKREIIDVSSELSEKILEREIKEEDHRVLIDSFLEKIGEIDESDK